MECEKRGIGGLGYVLSGRREEESRSRELLRNESSVGLCEGRWPSSGGREELSCAGEAKLF